MLHESRGVTGIVEFETTAGLIIAVASFRAGQLWRASRATSTLSFGFLQETTARFEDVLYHRLLHRNYEHGLLRAVYHRGQIDSQNQKGLNRFGLAFDEARLQCLALHEHSGRFVRLLANDYLIRFGD